MCVCVLCVCVCVCNTRGVLARPVLLGVLHLPLVALKRCPLPKMDPVSIAIRLTYVLRHWSLDEWPVVALGEGGEGGTLVSR